MQQRRTTWQGFTLIELLIVIALIGILVAALVPNILGPDKEAKKVATLTRMTQLKGCIERYNDKNGDFPPSSFANAHSSVKVKNNSINEGIECLLVHIHRKSLGRSATLEAKTDWFKNTDKDNGGFHIQLLDTSQLFEVMDAWGCPIVYFHEASYGQDQRVLMGDDGQEQETVKAWRDPVTNKYLNPRGYQLISAGDDGLFGTKDDITIPGRRN